MRLLPFIVCGLALAMFDGRSTHSHAQVLAWAVLFSALASTLDGAFRVITRDPDHDAGRRFVVLLATALGVVVGCGHSQLWARALGGPLAGQFAATVVTLKFLYILGASREGGLRALSERVRAAGWLRPAFAFAASAALGGVVWQAPSFLVLLATLIASANFMRIEGLDPDYVPGEPADETESYEALDHGPVARTAPSAPARMPLAPEGFPVLEHEPMVQVPACPLCAQPVLSHAMPCRECGTSEHDGCAGPRCSVCGLARALPRRAA